MFSKKIPVEFPIAFGVSRVTSQKWRHKPDLPFVQIVQGSSRFIFILLSFQVAFGSTGLNQPPNPPVQRPHPNHFRLQPSRPMELWRPKKISWRLLRRHWKIAFLRRHFAAFMSFSATIARISHATYAFTKNPSKSKHRIVTKPDCFVISQRIFLHFSQKKFPGKT